MDQGRLDGDGARGSVRRPLGQPHLGGEHRPWLPAGPRQARLPRRDRPLLRLRHGAVPPGRALARAGSTARRPTRWPSSRTSARAVSAASASSTSTPSTASTPASSRRSSGRSTAATPTSRSSCRTCRGTCPSTCPGWAADSRDRTRSARSTSATAAALCRPTSGAARWRSTRSACASPSSPRTADCAWTWRPRRPTACTATTGTASWRTAAACSGWSRACRCSTWRTRSSASGWS